MKMHHFILYILLRSILVYSQYQKTDLNKCKVTHTGIEYAGDISHTESGVKCQEWNSLDSSYHVYDVFTDNDFPERSKSRARNYCRNVKGRFNAPWCYTVDTNLNDDICAIPLCNFGCRLTLLGVEYGGNASVSRTGRKCLKWSEKIYRKYLKKYFIATTDRVLLDEKFPEMSRKKASNYCRNPTSDPNGPWCLVKDDFVKKVKYEKEYCDVELCDTAACSAGTSRFHGNDTYTHFVSLNNSDYLEFSIMLWNIDLENSTFRVAFSVYPLPLSAQILIDVDNGIELLISKHGLGFIDKTGKKSQWNHFNNLLSGYQKRKFTISWYDKMISIKISDSVKHIYTTYYDPNFTNSIIANNKGQFSYYSIMGDPAMWDLPCYSKCQEEITVLPNCNFHRIMNKTEFNYATSFIVRSDQTVYIEIRNSPNSKYPYFKIEILGTFNKTSIALIQSSNSTPEFFSCGTYKSILSYWSWTELKISAIEDFLQLEWIRSQNPSETICSIQHVAVANAKWYSICSEGVAHWMFGCERLDIPNLPDKKPPECVYDKKGETYKGTQWVTKSGQPCIPWIYQGLNEQTKGFNFGTSNRKEMVNYCRNLISNDDGPFCYTADVDKFNKLNMKKQSCNIRSCPLSQCKVTGLGKEYDGSLGITKTNRICSNWSTYNITNYWTLHNISIGKETFVRNLTANYCRNPNNNLFGPWCFTADKNVPVDLCDIRDCSFDDSYSMINNGTKSSSRMYIRPEWVTDGFFFYLKSWNPAIQVGVGITLSFEEGKDYFFLEMGAENNTKVKISYIDEKGGVTLLKENRISKLIPTGYWQGFWLNIPPYDIEFGYEESDTPIFLWENPEDSGIPVKYGRYVSFSNLGNYSVGISFPSEYCLVHQVYKNFENAFYPFNFYGSTKSISSKMVLHLKNDGKDSNGYVLIKFFGESEVNYVTIKMNSTHMSLSDETNLVLSQISGILLGKHWISLTISYNETYITIKTNKNDVLSWRSFGIRVLRLYYFVITAHDSVISWLSNCEPPSDYGSAIDGGWSKWSDWICSVRCGGGLGYRTRSCTNPAPNFKGKPCLGENTEDGECNKFECGCINPVTYEKINKTLEARAWNREINVGDDIIFQCSRSIISEIKLDSSGSYVQWLKNGYKIREEKLKFEEIKIEQTNLVLTNVREDDSGVYMCVVYPDCIAPNNVTFVPVTIVALVVNSNQAHDARETTQYQLICKGLILSFVYVDLTQYWELDNELMIDYTVRPLEQVDMDFIPEIEVCHSGVWACKITQNKLNLTWTTNKFKLNVIDPPSFWTHLTSEDAPSVIFHGWNYAVVAVFLWAVVILEIVGVSYTAYWYWKTRQELLGLRETEQ